MSDERNEQPESPAIDDMVARLIRAAGRREDPPRPAYERTLQVATATWESKVRRRSGRRLAGWIAAAALIASIAALFVTQVPPGTAPMIAQTERIIGTAELKTRTSGSWTLLNDEHRTLAAGSFVRTKAGSRAGLMLDGTISLRLADSTEVVLESPSRIRLLQGKVYLDTGPRNAAEGIEVVTYAGTATDLGTQFEILYRDDLYRLRVREGEVLLQRGIESITSRAGDELSMDSAGRIEQSRIANDHAEWQWVESLAPAPDIDGRPLTVLLQWVSRETGRPVRFDSPLVERKAAAAILHGSIRHVAPLDALAVMLATTDLEHTVSSDGAILIRLRADRSSRP